MIKTRTLNVSTDGLEVAFQGALPGKALDYLQAEKNKADEAGEEIFTDFGGLSGYILPNGAKGGYRYIFNQGLMAAKWQIKHSTSQTGWNFYAKMPSGALLEYGLKNCITMLTDDLRAMGAKVMDDSVSRFDVCCDIEAPGFEIDPKLITAHSATTGRRHYSQDPAAYRNPEDENRIDIVGLSRIETLTIGTMPGRQIQIYDKRKQSIKKKITHWFEVWGKSPKDLEPTWRVEFRAGKKHLKDWNIRTLVDLIEKAGDMALQAFKDIRYLTDRESNVTRSGVHPIWETARNEIVRFLQFARQGAVRGVVRECYKAQKIKQLSAMIVGLSATLCELHIPRVRREKMLEFDGGKDMVMRRLLEFSNGAIGRAIQDEPKELFKKMSRASRKYHFLDGEFA